MQKRAGQGTFGGRFGGRKSLQSRKSGRFGGTFGGRNSQTETKVSFRGQASTAEGCLHKHVRRPKVPSAAEPGFSQNGRNSAPLCIYASTLIQTCINLFYNTHTQAYKFLGASNHQKPQLQHTSNSHCSKTQIKPINLTMS
ncbi:hypothetical protein MANES_06G043049v8 [Manihot esculenta]|uniref:Uncharacterized protein n=1 Tax=Manihot esculenta TaxID=3983 RepID=A0ACB7HIN3_MANES|nr:hypothetical protein MANES_06G043049v8 [Manihot esculenta]